MKKIYKYTLDITYLQGIEMPKGAEILTVQQRLGLLELWAMVDPLQPLQGRTIEILGTGMEVFGAARKYIATVQSGIYMWHVFERI